MLRQRIQPPRDIFPPEPWALAAVRIDPKLTGELVGQAETMLWDISEPIGPDTAVFPGELTTPCPGGCHEP